MWFWLFLGSIFINLVSALYIRWLLKSIVLINEDVVSIENLIKVFQTHLKTIYEMEMFYGDETLQSLLKHTTELSNRLEGLDLLVNEEEPLEEEVKDGDT